MNHSTSHRFNVLIIGVIGISLFVWTSTASAGKSYFGKGKDAKIYPATMCLQSSGPANALRYSPDGSISNRNSTKPLEVNCPIMRDETAADYGLHEVRVRIGKSDLSKCTIQAILPTARRSGFKSSSRVSDTSVQRGISGERFYSMKFLYLSKRTQEFPKGTMYRLTCKLPPKSKIVSYYALEVKD